MNARLFNTLCQTGILAFFLPGIIAAQTGLEKCSPLLRLQPRSDEIALFTLAVRDLQAFELRLAGMTSELDLVSTYAPAGIAVVRTRFSIIRKDLLPLEELLYVDIGEADYREELPVPGHNFMVNRISALQTRYPSLNGSGRTVSVKEFLFDTLDTDLWGRVAPASAGVFSPHATLMATLAGGAGNSGQSGRGVAWGARLASSGYNGLLPDAEAHYEALDISVQNHSYGLGLENYYGAGALAYDQSVAVRPALLHIFSAGNSGDSSTAIGKYQGLTGFANLTGSFKMAKNALLLGSVDSFSRVSPFSSRGPAYDGRVKPDLVAFGQDGTSGAAALASGVAAVLQQAYANQHQGVLPPASLIRAVLVNGADDLETHGPDYATGFGNLNALRSAEILEARHYIVAALGAVDTFFLDIDVPPASPSFKITLAWDDPPAAPGAARALVNDLDLRLYLPAGQGIQLPLVLNTTAHADSLRLPAIPGIDTLNNLEQIVLDNPVGGRYRIAVHARSLGAGDQTFSLAYHWERADTFVWAAPLRMAPAVAGEPAMLYWTHTFNRPFGLLEYRLIGEDAWLTIDSQAALSPGYYRWILPDTAALLQMRMTIDGNVFTGDTFLASPEMRLKVGFYCPDSVLIAWNRIAQHAHYQVWSLADRYLEPLFVTADTFAILERAVFPQRYMAVSAVQAPGITGRHSGARNLSEQGVGCYFVNLLAAFDEEEQVRLSLLLGTTYGLDQVSVEKWEAGSSFKPLAAWKQPFGDLQFQTLDASPDAGPNYYRARLILENGAELVSDTATIRYSGPSGIWAFPNPAGRTGLLRVILRDVDEETRVCLFDSFGRFLVETKPEAAEFDLRIPSLAQGLYVLAVRQGSRWSSRIKVLVE